MQPLLLNRL